MNLVISPAVQTSLQRRTRFAEYLKLLTGLLLLAWLSVSVYHLIWRIVAIHNTLPIWDYWRVVQDYAAVRSGHISPLWQQHNEHRIVFPELIFLADMAWWHGRQYLPVVASVLFYAGTWVLLCSRIAADHAISKWFVYVAACVAGIILFWEGAAIIAGEPFLLVWSATLFGTATALISLSRYRDGESRWLLVLSLAAGTAATYSEASGIFVWPLLLVIAIALRLQRQVLAIITVFGGLNIAAYFIGYHSMGSLRLGQLMQHPLYALCFVASYLSMPFGALPGATAGLVGGFVLMVGSAACVATGVVKNWTTNRTWIAMTAFLAFFVITALLTASGRMNPTDPTYGAAKAVRYLIIPELGWCTFLLFAFWTIGRCSPPWLFYAAGSLVVVATAYSLPRLEEWIHENSQGDTGSQLATVGLESGVLDEELVFARVYPDLQVVRSLLKDLRATQKSIYYRGRDRWVGRPAAEFSPQRPEINGAITGAYPVQDGLQIVGWADDLQFRRRYTYVVLTDDAGKIAGFGRRFPAGFPKSALAPQTPASLAWAGYVRPELAGRTVHASILDGRRFGLMPIATPYRIPAVSFAAPPSGNAAVSAVTWDRRVVKGDAEAVEPGALTRTMPANVSGTYGGSDAAEGSVQSSAFARPADGCVILPVLHGPRVGGLAVSLENAQTGAVIESAPLRDDRTDWHYWKMLIPSGADSVRIVAKDSGSGWGEWVAVGGPISCSL